VMLMNHPYSAVLLKDPGMPEGFIDSPRSFKSDRISLISPPSMDRSQSLTHQPNNSLGLTVDVTSQLPSERPLSTGKSEAYPASVMSSRVVKAMRLKRPRSVEQMRPKLFIVTNPALPRKSVSSSRYDQSMLDISPPLRSRFSLPTTKSESPSTISYPLPAVGDPNSHSPSTISYPNPVVIDPQTLSPYSNPRESHQVSSDTDSESVRMQLENTGYSDVIQANMARSSRRMSTDRGHRPLPALP